MLVLTRKLGERILVPDCDLTVTVVAIEGNSIRLGITAPVDLTVYREEVWHRIRKLVKDPAVTEQGTPASFLRADQPQPDRQSGFGI
jgi:carbon storage regulator